MNQFQDETVICVRIKPFKLFRSADPQFYCINQPYRHRNHELFDEQKPLMCGVCIHCLFMGQNKNLKPILEKYKQPPKYVEPPPPSSPSYCEPEYKFYEKRY